ncbi:phosphoribosylglycinamide formyltransferase [Candidatus Epulonipiscium fishelsonii]|uniref:Phosphoribosylglycinamide formyltransferase n=1 Tax=Candidatus Epulonipiscium fishelsonii TaxID=77094 RepID=A0ACC8X8W5_9FIRM|nr:phosphoribosylglycinamide formyltransferase [Epulopiscium sp. SCG-D08WGA-EpuloA1]OON92520.1 MAG: phosphoribosylglycinamide formyltransferase [Epulopiscium sp. AS2M-Bin002]
MLKIAVLVSGGGTNLQAIIDANIPNTRIELVISSKPNVYALERAKNHNIQSKVISKRDFATQLEYENAMIKVLKEKEIDLIVLAGFMNILSSHFVQVFEQKIINVHPSLIPSFCGDGFYGLKVHEAALKKGVKITGATVHYVNEITDGGKIILQKAVDVLEYDTPETLQKRVMEQAEWDILPRAIAQICADLYSV